MAKYEINCEQHLGVSHTGDEYAEGNGSVELSDTEVAQLVELIRQSGSSDVNKLRLQQKCPEVFKKLDEACRAIAAEAEERHWLWEGYYDGAFDYDPYELMDYCAEYCGFSGDEEDFDEWLGDYLVGLPEEEAVKFFYEHMNANVDLEDIEYCVSIPQAIVEQANEG